MSSAQDSPQVNTPVTVEEVKAIVRRYCEQEYPGRWCSASVGVVVGEVGVDEELERLLVFKVAPLPR